MTVTIGVLCIAPDGGQSNKKHHWRFGRRSLLELVARRLTDCQQLDEVLVVAGPGFERSSLADVLPPDVTVLYSDRPDTLGQLLAAIDATGAAAVVKADLEHPFIDPVLIDRLVTTGRADADCDYVGFCLEDGRPLSHSPLSTFAEWCRADALRRADRLARPKGQRSKEQRQDGQRQDLARLMSLYPEEFHLKSVPVPAAFESEKLRLVADDDVWEHAQTIYDWLHPQEPHGWAMASAWSG